MTLLLFSHSSTWICLTMKLTAASVLALAAPSILAFSPSPTFVRKSTLLNIGRDPNVDLGGNAWKPDSEKVSPMEGL